MQLPLKFISLKFMATQMPNRSKQEVTIELIRTAELLPLGGESLGESKSNATTKASATSTPSSNFSPEHETSYESSKVNNDQFCFVERKLGVSASNFTRQRDVTASLEISVSVKWCLSLVVNIV
jgi:hypothetical protein